MPESWRATKLAKKWSVSLGALTTHSRMGNPSQAGWRTSEPFHFLEMGIQGHLSPTSYPQDPRGSRVLGLEASCLSIQAVPSSWLHDHMTKCIASPSCA